MKESMTIREYLNEMEVYPYSKEYFEILREASELNLLSLAVEAYDFYSENCDTLLTEQVDAISAIFCEDSDSNIESSGGEVKKSLLKRVINAILDFFSWIKNKIFVPFINALDKLIQKIPGLEKIEVEVPAGLKLVTKTLTKMTDTIESFNEFVEDGKAKAESEEKKGFFGNVKTIAKGAVDSVTQKARHITNPPLSLAGLVYKLENIDSLIKEIDSVENQKTTIRGYQLKKQQDLIRKEEEKYNKAYDKFEVLFKEAKASLETTRGNRFWNWLFGAVTYEKQASISGLK